MRFLTYLAVAFIVYIIANKISTTFYSGWIGGILFFGITRLFDIFVFEKEKQDDED